MPTKMRDYVDAQQGAGSWDRMHDLIDGKEIFGWRMPNIEVDGHTFSIFPGTNREATLEDVQSSIRDSLRQIAAGEDVDQRP